MRVLTVDFTKHLLRLDRYPFAVVKGELAIGERVVIEDTHTGERRNGWATALPSPEGTVMVRLYT